MMNLEKLQQTKLAKLNLQLIAKVIILCLGFYLFYYTINIITVNHPNLLKEILSFLLPAFLKIKPAFMWVLNNLMTYLIVPSVKFLWIPILIYILICLITPSLFWRKFLSLITVCAFILILHSFVFKGYSFPDLSKINLISLISYSNEILLNTKNIFVYLAGIYLFILWIFPPVIWPFFSGALLFVVGLIETVLPTQAIPFAGGIAEFLTLSAVFAYLFLFIHLLAATVKGLTNSSFIQYAHDLITKQKPSR